MENIELILSFSLYTTSPLETLTPLTPSSSSSQHPVSYFSPFPPSPGSTRAPPKRRHTTLLRKKSARPPQMSITSYSSLPTPILLPCHVCHRRPNIHSDLASYWACEVCERQTCHICMRACEGSGCHSTIITTSSTPEIIGDRANTTARGRSICAKCCVEVGAEGRVWCLVCYEDEYNCDDRRVDESDEEEDDAKLRSLRGGNCIGVEKWLERCENEPWAGG